MGLSTSRRFTAIQTWSRSWPILVHAPVERQAPMRCGCDANAMHNSVLKSMDVSHSDKTCIFAAIIRVVHDEWTDRLRFGRCCAGFPGFCCARAPCLYGTFVLQAGWEESDWAPQAMLSLGFPPFLGRIRDVHVCANPTARSAT